MVETKSDSVSVDEKLSNLEQCLFDASVRSEGELLQVDSSSRDECIDLHLHLPTEDPATAFDLLKISSILDSVPNSDHPTSRDPLSQTIIEQIYQPAYNYSFAKAVFPKMKQFIDRRVNELKDTPIPPTIDFDSCFGSFDYMELQRMDSVAPFEDNGFEEFLKDVQSINLNKEDTSLSSNRDTHPRSLRSGSKPKNAGKRKPKAPIIVDGENDMVIDSPVKPHQVESVQSENSNDAVEAVEQSSVPKKTTQDRKKQKFSNPSANSHGMSTRTGGSVSNANPPPTASNGPRKTLGSNRRRNFIPPLKKNSENNGVAADISKRALGGLHSNSDRGQQEEEIDDRLKNLDPKMIETIKNEIMDCGSNIQWDDIAGLHHAKKSIQEVVIWPMQRPDIFTGLRRAPKGILLFGPPGTGKTLIGKCIAKTAGCTFFSISASSLTSKWVGEGEKMVRALFAVARVHQPSVIFIDEIDSLLTQRSDGEVEASRRIKTEFLIQFDGAHVSEEDDHILIIGATNRPQEIDEAARRRLIKRYYIPLPDQEARVYLMKKLLAKQNNSLTDPDLERIAQKTAGYSGSDMDGLCREAALGPIREIPPEMIGEIKLDAVRPMTLADFEYALLQVRASVSDRDLELYKEWNKNYGSLPDAVKN